MCFERVLERGRGGSILLRKYVVSHNNVKNNIMEMMKGGCWEWAGRDERSTRGASLRPLQFCPAGISNLWYILDLKSVESICQPTTIPIWIRLSSRLISFIHFQHFRQLWRGTLKKLQSSSVKSHSRRFSGLYLLVILLSYNFLILFQTQTSRTLSENEGSEQIQQTLRYNVHKNLAECYSKSGELLLAEDHFFQVRRTWTLAETMEKTI